jgi:hypothetical protein
MNIETANFWEGNESKKLTGEPRKTMRWRRSMLVVSSSSRRTFLAAGLAAASPDGSHPTECVPRTDVAADARTDTAHGAILRPVEELGVRNTDDGEEEVHGGAGSAAMVAATASIPWPAAADFCCC